jgi:hypothetical protein
MRRGTPDKLGTLRGHAPNAVRHVFKRNANRPTESHVKRVINDRVLPEAAGLDTEDESKCAEVKEDEAIITESESRCAIRWIQLKILIDGVILKFCSKNRQTGGLICDSRSRRGWFSDQGTSRAMAGK